MVRRSYSGNAPATTLNGGINASTLSVVVTSATGYPAGGGAGPFFIVVDRGLSNEEKILVDSTSGSTFTVNTSGRGADGTTAATHASGAIVEHIFTKTDADEANAHVNDTTTDVHPQYTTTAELTTHENAADPHTAYLTSTEITALIAAAAVAVVPVGGITPYAGATAPTNWLLCNGATVSQTTYAALFAITGHAYGADPGGGNFILPDLKGKVPVGISAAETEFDARGETGGAKTVTLTEANLASHNHTQNAHGHNHTHGLLGVETGINNQDHYHRPSGGSGYFQVTPQAPQGSANETLGGGGAGIAESTDWNAQDHTHMASHEHAADATPATATNNAAGSGTAHNNLQPYVALHYIIRAL